MDKNKHDDKYVQNFWSRATDIIEQLVLTIFVFMTMFPGQALAFVDTVELHQQTLVFVRDPSLEGEAIVGIEEWPKERTVARLLSSRSMSVKASLASGSVVRVLATAYSSTCDQTDSSPFITASGRRVGLGTMATNFLPLGTKVRIGNNMYTVWDRMNSRYNGKYIVDIWMPTRAEAIYWGARVVEMEVVELP
jgi:3D (Asp-Asp-Asp) domain-containing protein